MSWGILYLHGVGQGVHNHEWHESLTKNLAVHGIELPGLRSRRIMVPDYTNHLFVPPTQTVYPPTPTVKEQGTDAEKLARASTYARRQAAAVRDLPDTVPPSRLGGVLGGISPETVPALGALAPVNGALGTALGLVGNVKAYLRNSDVRRAVMHEVLSKLGAQTDIIIIGHSLGSVVGIDLLEYLPEPVRVRRFITIGSPAGLSGMWKSRADKRLDFSYAQVEGWVNLLGVGDLVPRGQGIAPTFPQAADVSIDIGVAHSAATYLAHPTVGRVIADAMAPPRGGVVSDTSAIEVAASEAEEQAIDAVRFGYMVAQLAKNEGLGQRLTLAMDAVREQTAYELAELRKSEGALVPSAVAELAEHAPSTVRFTSRGLDRDLLFAVVAATGNPVAPYEIEAPVELRRAMKRVWIRMGYTGAAADVVRDSVIQAMRAFGKPQWYKYAFGAVGLALVAAGPVGLMVMAPAGLAGAAAVTAALAAFGPGGMIGGMALAGGLIGVGGAVTAGTAMTLGGMSPDALEVQCVRIMAYADAQNRLDIPGTRHVGWHTLSAWASELAAEREMLSPLSDKDSPSVKALGAKVKIVQTGIAWMSQRGLAPGAEGPEENAEAPAASV